MCMIRTIHKTLQVNWFSIFDKSIVNLKFKVGKKDHKKENDCLCPFPSKFMIYPCEMSDMSNMCKYPSDFTFNLQAVAD